MNKTYVVRLTDEERLWLSEMVSKGKSAAYKIKHANILLKVDADGPGWTDRRTAEAFGCHERTVRNIRQRLVEQGLEAAIERQKQTKLSREFTCDGRAEAQLIAMRCGEVPAGFARWTLRLLADKAVELEIVPAISHETVRQVLKKTNSSHI